MEPWSGSPNYAAAIHSDSLVAFLQPAQCLLVAVLLRHSGRPATIWAWVPTTTQNVGVLHSTTAVDPKYKLGTNSHGHITAATVHCLSFLLFFLSAVSHNLGQIVKAAELRFREPARIC